MILGAITTNQRDGPPVAGAKHDPITDIDAHAGEIRVIARNKSTRPLTDNETDLALIFVLLSRRVGQLELFAAEHDRFRPQIDRYHNRVMEQLMVRNVADLLHQVLSRVGLMDGTERGHQDGFPAVAAAAVAAASALAACPFW